MSCSLSDTSKLDRFLERTVNGRTVPAVFLGATTASGELYYDQTGERVFGEPDKGEVNEDTVLQIFSATKLITSVACLQLMDQGRISLHDADAVARLCPELSELEILKGYDEQGKEILVKPKNRITLNMLLNHTSGLAYPDKEPYISRWTKDHKVPGMLMPHAPISAYLHPLSFEPGTRFQYAVGVDWAGIIVARLTGLTLEEYFKRNIFEPCGMANTSFHPPKEYEQRRMGMCYRDPESQELSLNKGGFVFALERTTDPSLIGPNYSGGAGLYGTARDYLKFLRGVLASAHGEGGLISRESFELLFQSSFPSEHAEAMQADLLALTADQHYYDRASLEEDGKPCLGFSPGLLINYKPSKHGRSAMSGCWDGAARTTYWLDPKKGIAGVCFTNMLVPSPDPWCSVYKAFERTLYDSLDK